jgi:hypothetical protein
MLVPRHIGKESLAGPVVNQADDKRPHDRTPLLIRTIRTYLGFSDASSALENGFAGRMGGAGFRFRNRDEPSPVIGRSPIKNLQPPGALPELRRGRSAGDIGLSGDCSLI